MKLNIKYTEEEIIVNFDKRFIKVNLKDKSSNIDWTSEKINEFLIDLSANIADEEKLEISFDAEVENQVYKHVVNLFETFAQEYNR